MDAELVKFLDWFEAANLSSNTSIILMSDHGQRHGPLRNSMQGKLEESLPLMSIALSRQLMSRKKDAAETLRTNANRLTTPVDIHRTLLNLSGLRDSTTLAASGASLTSYSLIDEAVPETRSCSDAGIPTHWCSCLRLKKIQEPSSNELAVRAARFAVNQMNSATEPFRHLCHELQLGNVTEADVSLISGDLAKRERHMGRDFSYNMANSDLVASGYITVRLFAKPSSGLYEATVQFSLQQHSGFSGVFLYVSEPSRINRYGRQADCIAQMQPHLRKFC
uniref:Sulfatase domain-containing protein n=1 Tax=Macrostomum lignano TaxID=282301 RepID=A0A1I8H847_9PLAT